MAQSFAFPTLDSLVDLACRDGVDIRPILLRVLTDLYVQKPAHSADEEAQYVELTLRLIDAVDSATRATVIARLSVYPNAPEAILEKLAGRAPPAVTAPAAPTATKAPRPEVRSPQAELVELFFAANADERRLILTNLDVVPTAPRRPPVPSGDTIRRLENAALKRNTREFARTLQRALGIAPALAERVASDASGEPIIVAARALGVPAAVFQRIVLFLNPAVGQSVARVYELARLYDEVTTDAAQTMLSIWRQASPRANPRHVPATWDDERTAARAYASHERRRVGRSSETPPARVRSDQR